MKWVWTASGKLRCLSLYSQLGWEYKIYSNKKEFKSVQYSYTRQYKLHTSFERSTKTASDHYHTSPSTFIKSYTMSSWMRWQDFQMRITITLISHSLVCLSVHSWSLLLINSFACVSLIGCSFHHAHLHLHNTVHDFLQYILFFHISKSNCQSIKIICLCSKYETSHWADSCADHELCKTIVTTVNLLSYSL